MVADPKWPGFVRQRTAGTTQLRLMTPLYIATNLDAPTAARVSVGNTP